MDDHPDRQLQGAAALIPSDRSEASMIKAVILIITVIMIMALVRCLSKYCQDYYAERICNNGHQRSPPGRLRPPDYIPMSYFAISGPTIWSAGSSGTPTRSARS